MWRKACRDIRAESIMYGLIYQQEGPGMADKGAKAVGKDFNVKLLRKKFTIPASSIGKSRGSRSQLDRVTYKTYNLKLYIS